jgi:predicted phage-related endonuclease
MQKVPDVGADDKSPYVELVNADQERDAWLEARRGLITASDVPAVLGWPRVGARHELWFQKRDELRRKKKPAYVEEAGKMGHRLEPLNAELYQEQTMRQVHREQRLLRSVTYPFLGCTADYHIDAWCDRRGRLAQHPLELKSTAVEENWLPGQEPCAKWLIQVATQCLVYDVSWGGLSTIFGAPAFAHRAQDIRPELELFEIILNEVGDFWESIQRDRPPEWNADLSTYEVLRRLDDRRLRPDFVRFGVDAIELDDEYQRLDNLVKLARENLKAREVELELVEAQIAALIGEHSGARLPNGVSYSFKTVNVAEHVRPAHSYRSLKRITPKPLKGARVQPRKKRS